MGSYVVRGGLEGRERLRVLARVMAPTTSALLDRIGVAADARCLDVGCGGGDVTVELARRCPDGSVLGIDVDETKLARARADARPNVAFRHADVTRLPPDGERFDVVYVRFVLTHLTEPDVVAADLAKRLVPGGVMVVEDIDFTGHFCHPECPAFRRYVAWYTRAVRGRGADPEIGSRERSR
jgi:2-polyprenyl-3-methyl-5-hydroxy-6-metoxy-1,4-benzoquinol methylase